MQVSDLKTLFDYSYWARDKVLLALQTVDQHHLSEPLNLSHQTIMGVLTHILNAECLWRGRCQENSSPSSMRFETPFKSLQSLQVAWEEEQGLMVNYLNGLEEKDLVRTIAFKALNGDSYSSIQWCILTGLVTHGTHHRSEVTSRLRELGHSPGNLDFLIFSLSKAPLN